MSKYKVGDRVRLKDGGYAWADNQQGQSGTVTSLSTKNGKRSLYVVSLDNPQGENLIYFEREIMGLIDEPQPTADQKGNTMTTFADGPHDHDHLGPDAPQLRTSVGDLIQRLARIVLGADLRGLDETERRAMLDASATIESLAAENAALRDRAEKAEAVIATLRQRAGDRIGAAAKANDHSAVSILMGVLRIIDDDAAEAALAAANQPAADQKGNNDE
jgi:hypothetical protein